MSMLYRDGVEEHLLTNSPHDAVTAAGAQFGPPGYEVNLLYLACLAALALGGPGPLAIDNLIRKRRKVRSSQNKPTFSAAA